MEINTAVKQCYSYKGTELVAKWPINHWTIQSEIQYLLKMDLKHNVKGCKIQKKTALYPASYMNSKNEMF